MEAITSFWASKKQLILGIVIGLLVGPLISGNMGWQVSKAFLDRSVHNAVVKQQGAFCAYRARASVKDVKTLDKLEYSARYDLAAKWALLPGQTEVDSDVVSVCADGLTG